MRRRLLSPLVVALTAATAMAPAWAAQPQTWHASQARVSAAAQAAGRSGTGVLVAVIDTWLDTAHPSFGGRALPGVDCVGGCSQPVQRDNCSHGTHVAGTVASVEYGVAPRARILPLRILAWDGEQCSGNTDDAAAAVRYAVSRGADVINLSVGGDTPLVGSLTALPGAVSEAAAAGAVVVFAAGNQARPIADNYGGDALIVAATGPTGQLASYSQRGVGVDLAAPGGDPFDGESCRGDGSDCVASLFPDSGYAAMAGTSMAAPHVSGIAALLLAQRPDRGRADVMNRLTGTARPLASAGSGLVDASAALGVRPAPASPAPTTAAPRPPRSSAPASRRPATIPATAVPTTSAAPSPSLTAGPTGSAPASTSPSPSATPEVAILTSPPAGPPVARLLAGALVGSLLLGHAAAHHRRRSALR